MDSLDQDRLNAIFQHKRPPPQWAHWKHQTTATLSEAAALLFDIDPGSLSVAFLPELPEGHSRVIDMALFGHPQNGLIVLRRFNQAQPDDSPVDLAKFGAWAQARGYALPPDFPRDVSEETIRDTGWPWGSHSTHLLEKMAQAASRFWSRYDPGDPTTAPTNEQVSAWLVANGVSERTAGYMATILRADGLPTGPRKSA